MLASAAPNFGIFLNFSPKIWDFSQKITPLLRPMTPPIAPLHWISRYFQVNQGQRCIVERKRNWGVYPFNGFKPTQYYVYSRLFLCVVSQFFPRGLGYQGRRPEGGGGYGDHITPQCHQVSRHGALTFRLSPPKTNDSFGPISRLFAPEICVFFGIFGAESVSFFYLGMG